MQVKVCIFEFVSTAVLIWTPEKHAIVLNGPERKIAIIWHFLKAAMMDR